MGGNVQWWSIGALAGVVLLVLVVQNAGSSQRRHVDSWLERQCLPVRPSDRRRAATWRAHEVRGDLVGALVGLAVCCALGVLFPLSPQTDTLAPIFIPLAVLPLATSAGVAVAALLTRRPPPGVRVAHPWRPQTLDYVGRGELMLVRAIAGVAVTVLLVRLFAQTWAGPGFGPRESGPVGLTVGTLLVVWVLIELTVRRVVGLPQSATDLLELSWADAVRSEQVRVVYGLLTSFSALCILPATLLSPAATSYWAGAWPLVAYLVLVGAGAAAGALGRRPVRSVRRSEVAEAGRLQLEPST